MVDAAGLLRRPVAADNAAMEAGPPKADLPKRQHQTWVLIGAFLLLSGVCQIHHGVETVDWPFPITWMDYVQIGRPQIISGVAQTIAGVTLLTYAVVKARFQFSVRDLLWTVTLFCLGLWLIVSFRQIKENPLWAFLAVIVCTVSVAAAAGMYSASRQRRKP
jgi:hypothetical protein